MESRLTRQSRTWSRWAYATGLIVGTQETWLRLARLGAQPSEGRTAAELHLAVGHGAEHGQVQRVRRLPGRVAGCTGITTLLRAQLWAALAARFPP